MSLDVQEGTRRLQGAFVSYQVIRPLWEKSRPNFLSNKKKPSSIFGRPLIPSGIAAHLFQRSQSE